MAFSWAPFGNNVFLGHEAFSTKKKLSIISEKKERHSHHLIIFNYLVHPCRIFTKMVNEIKLMKTKMSQTGVRRTSEVSALKRRFNCTQRRESANRRCNYVGFT